MTSPMAPGQRGGTPFLIPAPQQSGVPSRGRGGGRGGVAGPQGSPSVSVSSTVQAVGVPRPGFGNAGRQINIRVNTSAMNIPDITVYHYDAVENSDRADSKMQLIKALQSQYPSVFIRAAVYDGNNNLYTSYKLNFGTELSRQFDVTWDRWLSRFQFQDYRHGSEGDQYGVILTYFYSKDENCLSAACFGGTRLVCNPGMKMFPPLSRPEHCATHGLTIHSMEPTHPREFDPRSWQDWNVYLDSGHRTEI